MTVVRIGWLSSDHVSHIRRRILIASALFAIPPFAFAQQKRAVPVIGLLGSMSADSSVKQLAGVRAGLTAFGYVDGQSVEIRALWSDGHYERLPRLVDDFIKANVDVILAGGLPAAEAAKAATAKIPIVFVMGADPVSLGIVSSMSSPGGNVTGVSQLFGALGAKRLELLRQLVPKAKLVAVLSNPDNSNASSHLREIDAAAKQVKTVIQVFPAHTGANMDAAFAKMRQAQADALLVADDPWFTLERERIVGLAARYALPAIYYARDFTEAGGLLSYGSNGAANYRLAGGYIGRILKGAKPAELPVIQPDKFELILNLKVAKKLGISVPQNFLARLDEVIQ